MSFSGGNGNSVKETVSAREFFFLLINMKRNEHVPEPKKDILNEARPWEGKFGKDTVERVQRLGRDSHEYRESVHLPPIDKESKHHHEVYMQNLGSDMLKTMFTDDQIYEKERTIALKKQSKIGQLLKKRIKVTDFEDGGLNISMEQDWDTSSWNDTLVEAAAEALVYVFYDLSGQSTLERKERAIQMLKKLMDRHPAAETYVRKNLEMIMGKAASKLIRKGISGGILNLLYVINSCKDKFSMELSNYNFTGRIIEMLILEARLAAILIQHSFRAKMSKKKLKANAVKFPHLKGFGTEKEVYYRQLGVINSRSSELRYYWRLMHNFHPKTIRNTVGGMRGPIHVGESYLILCLDILRYLVSDSTKTSAHSNREDLVRANGCILLSTYIGTPNNKFASYAVQVVAEIAKVAESFYPIVESGCIASTIKYMKYLRTVYGVGIKVIKAKRTEGTISLVQAYLSCLDIIANTCLHASSIFRAKEGYQYVRASAKGIERTDYRQVLSTMLIKNNVTLEELTKLMCNSLVLNELSTVVLTAQQNSLVTRTVFCFLILLSSQGHHLTLNEILAGGGKLLIKFLEFLISDDLSLSTMALCIFHQVSSFESSRKSISMLNIPGYILPLFQKVAAANQSQNRQNRGHLSPKGSSISVLDDMKISRLLLTVIYLSRQKDWKLYDPELLYEEHLQGGQQYMKEMIYLNLLRTIKDRNFNGSDDQSSCADLLLLPTVHSLSIAMDKVLLYYPVNYLMEYLFHPQDSLYYESCPLDEVCTIASIIHSFSFYKPFFKVIYSKELVLFLCKFLFLVKYIFLNKKLVNRQLVLFFQGIKASILILSEFIPIILKDFHDLQSYLTVIKETQLIEQSIFFYLNTLQEYEIQKVIFDKTAGGTELQNPHFSAEEEMETNKLFYTLQLQKEVGICCIRYLTKYGKLISFLNDQSSNNNNILSSSNSSVITSSTYSSKAAVPLISLQDLNLPGKKIVQLLFHLKKLYQQDMIPIPTKSRGSSRNGSRAGTPNNNDAKITLKDTFHYYNAKGDLIKSFYANKNITFQFNSYHQEMTFIQDCLCHCLSEMTKLNGGTVTALQEWDIQKALRAHLPPPLSGYVFSTKSNQIPDPTKQDLLSSPVSKKNKIRPTSNDERITPTQSVEADGSIARTTSTSSEVKSVQSPHHSHKANHSHHHSHGSTRAHSEVLLKDENFLNYRLELMEIPSSLFDLCANLCSVPEGKVFCLIDGFLRRGLDKLTLLHSLLPTNQTHEMTIKSSSHEFNYLHPGKVAGGGGAALIPDLSSTPMGRGQHVNSKQGNHAFTRSFSNDMSALTDNLGDDDYYHKLIDYSSSFQKQQSVSFPLSSVYSSEFSSPSISHNTSSHKWNQVFSWVNKKKDFISCLKLIKICANYHHKEHGSTNELILNPQLYSVVAICKDIIKLHIKRNDELILIAYETLAELAKDTFHFHQFMEENHILELVKQELLVSVDFPLSGIVAAMNIIYYSCQGITSNYIITMIPLLREPLIKTSRIYPALNEHVRNTNWILTKSAMIYKSTIDPNYSVAYNQNNADMEEFFRTGNKDKWAENNNDNTVNNALNPSEPKQSETISRPMSAKELKKEKLLKEVENGDKEHHQHGHHHHHKQQPLSLDQLGDYSYCGISNCGSLRFPDAPHKHGLYQQYSEEETSSMLKKLPVFESSTSSMETGQQPQQILPLTKLPANEKYLQETIKIEKGKAGFTEIQKVNIYELANTRQKELQEYMAMKKKKQQQDHKRSVSAPKQQDHNNNYKSQPLSANASLSSFASPVKGSSSASSNVATTPIRSISVTELPELKLTRPKLPKE
jgi:hypothetical protein